jgi:hypothetical protein
MNPSYPTGAESRVFRTGFADSSPELMDDSTLIRGLGVGVSGPELFRLEGSVRASESVS